MEPVAVASTGLSLHHSG